MSKKNRINLNGEILDAGKAVFTATNRSFRYGDGLFESMRMLDGKIPLLPQHFERLQRGCELLKLRLPETFTTDFLMKQMLALSEVQGVTDNARMRLTLFRTEGGFYLPRKNACEYLVEAEPMKEKGFPLNKEGYRVDLFTEIEKPTTHFFNFKTNNALTYVLAAIHREQHGWDDCLLINDKGRVIETIDSNIFLVRADEVHTPPLVEGCVAGVMREYVINLLQRQNIAFKEIPITLEELFNADEIFLTNAIHGIRWVGQYKVKEYGNYLSKKLSQLLNSELASPH